MIERFWQKYHIEICVYLMLIIGFGLYASFEYHNHHSKLWLENEIKQERQTLINLKLDYFHVTGEMYGSDEVHQP